MDKLTVRDLTRRIVGAIRSQAKEGYGCTEGAIRLLFVPKNHLSINFLNAIDANCGIDIGFNLSSEPSSIEDAIVDLLYYDYAGCHINGCACAIAKNHGYKSSDLPGSLVTEGRSDDAGCVAYDVFIDRFGFCDDKPIEPYFRIYVSVFGAMISDEENEKCALAAGKVLQEWCDSELDDDGFGHFEKYLSLVGPE